MHLVELWCVEVLTENENNHDKTNACSRSIRMFTFMLLF